jgi:hypothetical protein
MAQESSGIGGRLMAAQRGVIALRSGCGQPSTTVLSPGIVPNMSSIFAGWSGGVGG